MDDNSEDLSKLICFCFKYSKKDIFDAVNTNTEESIIQEIKDKMKDPGCFCEKANPSGKCCLKDIDNFIEKVKIRN